MVDVALKHSCYQKTYGCSLWW